MWLVQKDHPYLWKLYGIWSPRCCENWTSVGTWSAPFVSCNNIVWSISYNNINSNTVTDRPQGIQWVKWQITISHCHQCPVEKNPRKNPHIRWDNVTVGKRALFYQFHLIKMQILCVVVSLTCINYCYYTLSREYRMARYRYSRLLFTSEDCLCANLRGQWQ